MSNKSHIALDGRKFVLYFSISLIPVCVTWAWFAVVVHCGTLLFTDLYFLTNEMFHKSRKNETLHTYVLCPLLPSSLCLCTVEEGPNHTLTHILGGICDRVLWATCLQMSKLAAASSFREASVFYSGITRMWLFLSFILIFCCCSPLLHSSEMLLFSLKSWSDNRFLQMLYQCVHCLHGVLWWLLQTSNKAELSGQGILFGRRVSSPDFKGARTSHSDLTLVKFSSYW